VSLAVLILLPPSEGKTAPVTGRRLSLRALGFPELNQAREDILDALIDVCERPIATASKILGITSGQADLVELNSHLRNSPCAPAGEVYTGVLYDALDWPTLTATARRRAGERVAIASSLFGLVRPTDPIPAYRLSADTALPGLPETGRLRGVWNSVLPDSMAAAAPRGVIWDLGSAAYAALGPVPADAADRTAITRVLQIKGTKRVVVSHHNKATKGRLTRVLLSGAAPKTVPDLAGLLGAAGYRVELQPGKNETSPYRLDVIVDAI
jgi:cytoplasmic iron level regulating protein YaaA (DUF328/UPF0246 family)